MDEELVQVREPTYPSDPEETRWRPRSNDRDELREPLLLQYDPPPFGEAAPRAGKDEPRCSEVVVLAEDEVRREVVRRPRLEKRRSLRAEFVEEIAELGSLDGVDLAAVLASPTRVYVAHVGDTIVGITLLVPHHHLPGLRFHIEDVVVDEKHRRRSEASHNSDGRRSDRRDLLRSPVAQHPRSRASLLPGSGVRTEQHHCLSQDHSPDVSIAASRLDTDARRIESGTCWTSSLATPLDACCSVRCRSLLRRRPTLVRSASLLGRRRDGLRFLGRGVTVPRFTKEPSEETGQA